MEISNAIFISNIEFRRNELGIKIGDLEKSVEVSTGYFSRLSKSPETLPNIDLALKVSYALNISLDLLLRIDLKALSSSEQLVYNYLCKIRDDTISGKIEWIHTSEILDIREADIAHSKKKYGFKAYTNGSVDYVDLTETQRLQIKPLKLRNNGIDYPFLSIDLKDNKDDFVTIADTCNSSPIVQAVINELYSCIQREKTGIKLTKEMKSLLNDFINQK